ncbi:MAG: kinase [Desulfobacteraceae bacterium]|jgi:D-glycero-alpha-D-manno-heptose-7-phosphate kinase
MVISRTPYRISFFGGGTDFPGWFMNHPGSVLSTSIDKYCYISLRDLPPFFEHKIRVVYSRIETCRHVNEIQHPVVRNALEFLKLDRGLEIHHDGDLPARSGMGSSSSFTVGLLNALYAICGNEISRKQLASESIYIEQDLVKDVVGCQDQIAAAYGGLNHIEFKKNGDFNVNPVHLSERRVEELRSHLMLFYTGIQRNSSEVAKTYVEHIEQKQIVLKKMHQMVHDGLDILKGNSDIKEFGKLMHDAWMAKRSLSAEVSNITLDDYYRRAISTGAIGGKITGAGGGGFLLLFVLPKHQAKVINELSDLVHIPFQFDTSGSTILYSEIPCKKINDGISQGMPMLNVINGSRVINAR